MSSHPSMEENAERHIEEIRSVAGVVACALVSIEGRVLGKYFRDGGLTPPLFAAMSATVLAAAEAACGSADVERPSMVTITAADAVIVIVGVDEVALITAIINKSADLSRVQRQLSDIAVRIGEEG